MTQKIQIRRGLKADLPVLSEGEFGFCLDTKELYIGTSGGNVLVNNFSWSNILGKPSFSTVATTGSYNDLLNKPFIPSAYTLPIASTTTLGGVKVGNGITLGSDGTISVSGSTGGTSFEVYKTEPIGEIFNPPANYNAWCPSNLQFDKKRGVYAVLINGANAHVFTELKQYFCTINPDTLVSTPPKLISVVDTNGNAVTFDVSSSNNFMVFEDGTYMYLLRKNGIYQRITSVDGGVTWVDRGQIVVSPSNSLTTSSNIWGITKLSNGRLICGFGAQTEVRGKLMYSDNNGVNWTFVSVGTNYPSGTTSAEPCIIEVSPNKLISLARRTTGGAPAGSVPEPALISFSTDNGATWTNYKNSTSILNMNASGATAYVHDGIVEVFVASRYYSTTANSNTGETGSITHYIATVENALNDNFTFNETTVYANATNSVNFHSPCVSIDDQKRLLLMYMDESEHQNAAVNYWFVRGGLGYVSYKNRDGAKSPIFSYSGKYIEYLISNLRTDLATLQYAVSQISSGGTGGGSVVNPPTGTLLWTKQYNAQNEQILLVNDPDFTGKTSWGSTNSVYNQLRTDENGITYHWNGNHWGMAITTTKPNFAIAYKGTVGNNSVGLPVVGALINGVGYGIYKIGPSYGLSRATLYDFRFEYWNGTMKAFVNDNEVAVKTFPFDSTNVINYTYLTNVIGTVDKTKIYAIHGGYSSGNIYEVKFGEWDN
ncbi:exo-alpha-sialidase [Bacillus sp. EB106-08-02-XG196]|uniref:hyaluronate lyase N-terminal domain-containing protein n=1 Tax=Bacillus sp. EB106-08-02-XG196 TaxID=2737049 RepID=UPI0015C4BCCF|nr:exo-alpha-sialidase [Bacillus sp. EB106-08-02-XG196]NWQ39149.1 exo-alpha-sialidase [Bacillus sp. EB106-08-02-XG196]